MDNTYYILAKEQNIIERLHICTWEFLNDSSYIEFGVEFSYEKFTGKDIVFYIATPIVQRGDVVSCLLKNLSDSDNGRFIFNDVVNGIDNVGNDSRDGCILKFDVRPELTILPCDIEVYDGYISFKIKKPQKYRGNLYFRVLLKIEKNTIAIKKSGIAQNTYVYDLKINETRNIPQYIYDLKKKEILEICEIKNLFCLHAVPDKFVFNFVDSSKLKNIRKLETVAFQKYLPEIKSISKDCYNIMFLKDNNCDGKKSYSLFTICTEETIGSKQIALAIGANILCSLLFAVSSLRFNRSLTIDWYCQVPWEYWTALGILLFLSFYLFVPFKSFGYCLKRKFIKKR